MKVDKLTLKKAKRMMDEDGNLDLSGSSITSLPDNLTVGGGLDLCNTGVTSLPDNLTVGGWLDLSGTSITSLPDNLTVGGWLNLCNTGITSLPDNLTVGGGLDLRGTSITALPDNLTVGGWLDLSNTGITALPDNLTVGGSLYLSDTGITTLPDNLTVGGGLDLSNTGITALPDNLAVGGWLDLRGTSITAQKRKKARKLKDGDYVPGRYLYADGILTHVKQRVEVDGYTLYIGKIKGKNVVSDGTHYAHCDKLRDGIADLAFKTAADRGAGQYEGLPLDTELTVDEAKTMYRVITGACRAGTDAFVESLGDALKERYTIREMLELTRGQYNSERFAEFFGA